MHGTRVSEVMTQLVVTLRPSDTVHEAAARLARNDISGAPVLQDAKVVGVVTEDDIVRALARPAEIDDGVSVFDLLSLVTRGTPTSRGKGLRVADIMSTQVATIPPDATVWKAAEWMQRRNVKRLPVVDDSGSLIGVVSRADLVRFMGRDDSEIEAEVRAAIEVLGEDQIPDLHVAVHHGVATLSGTPDRTSTRKIAARIAARIPGVVEVLDRMQHGWDDSHIEPRPAPRSNVPAGAWNPGVVEKL